MPDDVRASWVDEDLAVLVELADVALRSLERETQRLRAALDVARQNDEQTGTAAIAGARMSALDAMELWQRAKEALEQAREEA